MAIKKEAVPCDGKCRRYADYTLKNVTANLCLFFICMKTGHLVHRGSMKNSR